ncbi:uncharacterized protein LOC117296758 isoform X1 [Asterias rubens]|uniref:uncharacterized protein LOC117296758 isoform X1 n=1 Tax=Asterias rubens TaxID=7604 RepID=UPI001455A379|nr:uncharacterized protein LOC117296758 isoform X1 [Asterias rubens]
MRISRGQHTPLAVGFCLILLSLFGRQRCTAFPVVEELPADPWGNGADLTVPKTKEEYGNEEGFLGGGDIFTGDKNAEDQAWGSYVDLPGDGDGSLGHYDANDWGSFFTPSSDNKAEYDYNSDYDPLGGGMFTSDIIDPSISHSLYGGSTSNQDDIPQTGDGHNSNMDVKLLPVTGLGFDAGQDLFDTNGMMEQGGVGLQEGKPGTPAGAGGESNHETNAVDGSVLPGARPIQDVPNVLSSVLAKDDDIPAVPQEADMSVGFNGIGLHARHGATDQFTDEKDDKPAGRPLDESLGAIQHTSRTEGDSVHSLLRQIVLLVNRLIEAQGKQTAS